MDIQPRHFLEPSYVYTPNTPYIPPVLRNHRDEIKPGKKDSFSVKDLITKITKLMVVLTTCKEPKVRSKTLVELQEVLVNFFATEIPTGFVTLNKDVCPSCFMNYPAAKATGFQVS